MAIDPNVYDHHVANLESKRALVSDARHAVDNAAGRVKIAQDVLRAAKENLAVLQDEEKILSQFVEENQPELPEVSEE